MHAQRDGIEDQDDYRLPAHKCVGKHAKASDATGSAKEFMEVEGGKDSVQSPRVAPSSEMRPLYAQAASSGRTRAEERVAFRAAAWSWQNEEGVWKEYEPAVCDLVEQAFQMGQKAVCPSQQHVIVFHEMEQRLVDDLPPQHPSSAPEKSTARPGKNSFHASSTCKKTLAARGLASHTQAPASRHSAAQLARPVRRHASCGRAEALVALRARNAELRDGWWRAQQEQQKMQQEAQAEHGRAGRLHAHASWSSAAATASQPTAVGNPADTRQGLRIGDGGGLVGIGCCLEHDPLLGVVFISSVRPGGAAALSGKVAVGDVLVKVDGTAVASLEDAADLLVGPEGSLVILELLWRGKVATVALVRQHTLVLPTRSRGGTGAYADAEGSGSPRAEAVSQWRIGIGVDVDFVKGVPTIVSLAEGGAAASSQGLQEGDEVVAIDGDACCGGELVHKALDISEIRDALEGPPWSRVMLTISRREGEGMARVEAAGSRASASAVSSSHRGSGDLCRVNSPGVGGETVSGVRDEQTGSGARAQGKVGDGGSKMEGPTSADIAVIRAPDAPGDEVLFSAKVAYQAALVEALQRTWLDGPAPVDACVRGAALRRRDALCSSRFLECAQWEAASDGDPIGGESRLEGSTGERGGRGWGRGSRMNGGVIGAAVRGLGEEIGETANGVITRAQVCVAMRMRVAIAMAIAGAVMGIGDARVGARARAMGYSAR